MSALLLLVQLVVQLVLVVVILGAVVFVAWVLWDCAAGPSARLAAEHRARGRAGVDGR